MARGVTCCDDLPDPGVLTAQVDKGFRLPGAAKEGRRWVAPLVGSLWLARTHPCGCQ